MFERVTTHYQTLQSWTGHNATRYHNFNARYHTYYHTRYRTFSFNLAWSGTICNGLPRVIVKFILKIYINIFQKN